MIHDEEVLRALDKPRKLFDIHKIVNPSSKLMEQTQQHLLMMRDAGKVKFDIRSAKWSKA